MKAIEIENDLEYETEYLMSRCITGTRTKTYEQTFFTVDEEGIDLLLLYLF